MYAIIRTGGKQYKVQVGDTLRVEKLDGELGAEFDVTDVLVVGGEKTYVGEPTLNNAKVTVVVTKQTRAPKVIVFKKKRRQGYRKMQGHRQLFTELFIKSITSPEGQVAQAEKNAVVANPEKNAQRKARVAELKANKKEAAAEKPVKKAATKKKATKKKKAVKKAAGKKTAAKKKTAKKKTAKKATKATKKKTSK